jgi:HEAT repeat protein
MWRGKIALAIAGILGIGILVSLSGAVPAQVGKKKKKDAPPVDPTVIAAQQDAYKDDQRIVREAGIKPDAADLLKYFKDRTLKAPDPKEIALLVSMLGDEDFNSREDAFKKLVAMGPSALAGLKEGETNPDLEVRKRVGELKLRIDTKAEPALQAAAARVIAKLNPDGATDVLMAYLPFASDPGVIDEIAKTLGVVGVKDGKVEAILLKALTSELAVNRGVAGEAIARADAKDELANVKKLLQDKDISVRFRICMAMIPLQDKEIVPVMIDLMNEMTPNQLWPIEEALLRLAGDKAPQVSLGNDAPSRKTTRDAWAKWYGENEKALDMAKLTAEDAYLGYTLIVQHNNRIGVGVGNVGEIFELDKDKNVRWKMTLQQGYPVDAQVVGPNRILVCEYQGGRVTERDTKGEVKWEFACGGNPFMAQRLPNGNTFIAMQGRLLEIDRNKNEVWSMQRPNQDIMRAKKLNTGEVVYITNLGVNATYTRMDPKTQKINKSFNVMQTQMLFGNIEILRNGNVIIPHYNQQRVVEYNQDGGQVNTVNLNWPNSVVRLPNGNNLITSYNQRQVYEYNGNQQTWNYQTDGIVFVARRR